MELVILGSAGYHPTEERQTTCLLLPEPGIVLDAGTAMFRIGARLRARSLDIFLSHAHLDHVVGLTYLLNIARQRPLDRIRVHGRADKLEAVREHLFAPSLFPVTPPFQSVPLTGPVPLRGGGQLTHFPLIHPGGSLGFRLEWPGHSLAYVTDTTADPRADYVRHIQGVDLLVHECYFPDGMEEQAQLTGHSCLGPVLEVARAASVGRLALIHLNPLDDPGEVGGLTTAPVTVPPTCPTRDGMILQF
jgi:ribonuclease BN (tRNA processing enzyme)